MAYDEDQKRIETLEMELQILKKLEGKQKDQVRLLQKQLKTSAKAADKIEDSRQNTASALDRTATTLHSGSDQLSDFGHSAADRLQSTAAYLRETDLQSMGQDIQDLIRRYPAQCLAAAAVLGFLVARGLRGDD